MISASEFYKWLKVFNVETGGSPPAGALLAVNNLSDVQSKSTSQGNIGLLSLPIIYNDNISHNLTNPMPSAVTVNFSTPGLEIRLAVANAVNSMSPGQQILLSNTGSVPIVYKQNSGASIIVTLNPGDYYYMRLIDNSTSDGTWAAIPYTVDVNGFNGHVSLDGSNINSLYSAVNYTPTSSTLDGNFQGIDNALGGALGLPTGPFQFVNTTTALSNPAPYFVFSAMSSPGQSINLPPAQGSGALRKGQSIRILCQAGSQSVQVNDSAGGAVQALAVGDEVSFYLDTNSTTAGTWVPINTVSRVNLLSGDVTLTFQNIYDYLGGIITTTSGNPFALTSTGVTPSPDASSLFDCQSTTQGTRSFPAMTLTQRNAIASPVSGLHVYNTTYKTVDYFDGAAWQVGLTLDHLLAGDNITLVQNGDGTVTINSSGVGPAGNADYAGYGINNNLTNTIFSLTDTYYPVNINSSTFIDIISSNFVNEVITLSGIDTPAFRYIDDATQEFNFNINLTVYSATDIYIFQIVILKADLSYVYTNYFGSIIPEVGSTIQTSSMPLSGIVELSTGDSILIFVKNSTGTTALNIKSGNASVSNVNAAAAATLQTAYNNGNGTIIVDNSNNTKPFAVGKDQTTLLPSYGVYVSSIRNLQATPSEQWFQFFEANNSSSSIVPYGFISSEAVVTTAGAESGQCSLGAAVGSLGLAVPFITADGQSEVISMDYPISLISTGSSTFAGQLAKFSSGTSPTSGNIYGICIEKYNTDLLFLGINKDTDTNNVPANCCFISSFQYNSSISIGRGGGNGLPSQSDIFINHNGFVGLGINSISDSLMFDMNNNFGIVSKPWPTLLQSDYDLLIPVQGMIGFTTDDSRLTLYDGAANQKLAYLSDITGGVPYTEVTGTTQSMVADNEYTANNAGLVTLTLPTTAAIGTVIIVNGKGAGGWSIAQNASQLIHFGSAVTTTGTGGSLTSTNQWDNVRLKCVTADTTWVVQSVQGNLTVV